MFSKLLSSSDNVKLNSWIKKKDKPLFITGYNGSGKTYWANELLKDYHIININSEHIKFSKDITEHLQSSLLKKDIFMMISPDNEYKALLIDDIQLFIQSDKPTLSKIHKFVRSINYIKYPIIFICNETEDKCCKSMKLISYVIEINYNKQHYRDILCDKFDNDIISSFIKQTKNLNTIISTAGNFDEIKKDNELPVDVTLNNILTKEYTITDIIRLCSSDYTVISLNTLENIPYLIKPLNNNILYDNYKSVVYDDYIEYKYIQNNIDVDVRIFYSCVYPLLNIKSYINNMVKLKYNKYISHSIIQIHNQTILRDETELYLGIVSNMYKSLTDDDITINLDNINLKTLEKQMKVFNYYYNKNMNKKQFTKIIKNLQK
uniref:Uncharacterized protein n=1 Tax=viral metagenome TaxID=1070528 RepID=A0A6C0CD25_9ZZZZ